MAENLEDFLGHLEVTDEPLIDRYATYTVKVVPESHQCAKRRANAVPANPIGCEPQYHRALGMLPQHHESTPRCYARLPGV